MGDDFDTSHIYDTCDMIVTWFIVIITIVIMAYGPWLIQLSQSLKVLTLQFGLTNVRPKRSVQDRGKPLRRWLTSVEAEKHLFFFRNESRKEKHLHLLENPWNGSTFWRCFFFVAFFYPGLAVVYIQFSLLSGCFRCRGNIPNKRTSDEKLLGLIDLPFFCCCQLS